MILDVELRFDVISLQNKPHDTDTMFTASETNSNSH